MNFSDLHRNWQVYDVSFTKGRTGGKKEELEQFSCCRENGNVADCYQRILILFLILRGFAKRGLWSLMA